MYLLIWAAPTHDFRANNALQQKSLPFRAYSKDRDDNAAGNHDLCQPRRQCQQLRCPSMPTAIRSIQNMNPNTQNSWPVLQPSSTQQSTKGYNLEEHLALSHNCCCRQSIEPILPCIRIHPEPCRRTLEFRLCQRAKGGMLQAYRH